MNNFSFKKRIRILNVKGKSRLDVLKNTEVGDILSVVLELDTANTSELNVNVLNIQKDDIGLIKLSSFIRSLDKHFIHEEGDFNVY